MSTVQYPLDLTGVSPGNKITGELHIVGATGTRAIVLNHGPFYTRGMIVRNMSAGGQVLVPDTDYSAVQLFEEVSIRTGKQICAVILIGPGVVGTNFTVECQILGGVYSASVYAIEQMIAALELDQRAVRWGQIIGKPLRYPGAPHFHDIGDVYGFEFIVAALNSVREAILVGDQASHNEIYQYIDHQDDEIRALISGFEEALSSHVNNFDNPHNTDKEDVGLGNVQNYLIASEVEAQQATLNTRYMTPLRTGQAIELLATSYVNAHAAIRNAHGTTKEDVELGNVDNYPTARGPEAAAATSLEHFMTPGATRVTLAELIGNAAEAHFLDTDNPHETDKTDVGLGNVPNFLLATVAHAQEGLLQDRFMNPYLVRLAIEAFAGGRWTFTGSDQWGCAREERSGLTIQWGISSSVAVGRAQIMYYRRRWSDAVSGGKPFTLIPSAVGDVNPADTGEWATRSPFYATWFRAANSLALPPGTNLPTDARACFIAFGRHGASTAASGTLSYIAVGHTDADSIVTDAPSNGRGTVVLPYIPAGAPTLSLNPTSVTNTRGVVGSSGTIYSDYVTPTLGGGDGTYVVVWSIFNNGGRPADISISQSGNSARLAFNASGLDLIGEIDTVAVTLRCSSTSAGNTTTQDVIINLTGQRVYNVLSEPTNLDFEAGDTGFIKSGNATISMTNAFGGNWKGRIGFNGSSASSFYAEGARACSFGQTVRVACMIRPSGASDQVGGQIRLIWLNSLGEQVGSTVVGNTIAVGDGATWRQSVATGVVPAGVSYYTVQGEAYVVPSGGLVDFDNFNLNYIPPAGGGGGGPGGGGPGGGDPANPNNLE